MQGSQVPFHDAVARAKEIAQRLSANAPISHQNISLKRSINDEDGANKRPAFDSSNLNSNDLSPALRAQMIAQKINSQLGVPPSLSSSSSSSSSTNSSSFEEDYKIPDKFVGLVIGKGGEQIFRIQKESGCKVKISNTRPDPVPGGPNPPDRIANLSGSREAIEQAKKIIDDIVSRGKTVDGTSINSNPYAMGGLAGKSIDMMLPSAKCGLIIGKGGETIRRISEELGVKMFVVQDIVDVDGIEHKPLKITGDPERVERAREHVFGILNRSAPPANRAAPNSSNDYGSRTSGASTNGPCNEATYHVPYDKAGVIIGKGGESVKEISRRSGALVELDKTHVPAVANSGERLFKIRGTPDQIALAQQLMYEKVFSSAGGPGDLLPPLQFQQKFNLPLLGGSSNESWPSTVDPYGSNSNGSSNDLYSQWANAYGQWPQMNSYDDGSGKSTNNASSSSSSSTNNPTGAGNPMDPAWLAYYQSMNFYNMMQSSMTGNATSTANSSSNTTDSTTTTTANTSSNSTSATSSGAGQADYTQQWIEYYRSLGQNDLADQIAQQTKENGGANGSKPTATGATPAASMMSSQDAWAAYAQQWATNNTVSNSSNGHNSSTKH